jgi:hypothetical protein
MKVLFRTQTAQKSFSLLFGLLLLSPTWLRAQVLQQPTLLTKVPINGIVLTPEETKLYKMHEQRPQNTSVTIIQVGKVADFYNGTSIAIKVPDTGGLPLTVKAGAAKSKGGSDYTWAGTIEESGYFMLDDAGGWKSGFIQTDNQFWSIIPLRPHFSLLIKHNMAVAQPDCKVPTGTETSSADNCSEAYNTCPAIIDVLLFATDAARRFAGGGAGFEGMVRGAEFTTNYAFERSDIPNKRVRFRWIEHNPGYAVSTLIENVGDAFELDPFVNQNMELYEADLAVLVTDQGYSNGSGYSTIAEAESPSVSHRHSVVEISFFYAPNWTMPHEITHLLGAKHNRSNNVPCNFCGNDFDGCAHGFRFTAGGASRYTIHALFTAAGQSRVLNFSNPDVSYLGAATGNGNTNNARVIRNTGCMVSNYASSPEFGILLSGSPLLCGLNGVVQPNNYTAILMPPAPGFPGVGPYTIEWWWNTSGLFSYQSPDQYLGATPQVSITSPLACDFFFLHLKVTAADGVVKTDTRKIQTVLCNACNGNARPAGDRQSASARTNQFLIAPNPSTGLLRLEMPVAQETLVTLRLYDAKNQALREWQQVAFSPGSPVFEADLSGIPLGSYWVSVTTATQTTTLPFILLK